uniref:VTT domain-containing protein n=1 Tax=Chrysotila carterae TaxID=13221 RepID=A0A7S4B033_CHRCT|mmetsp:Transcript_39707/g.83312  ORF Transcript_39707/g.83312 Transcript_39707/m.83312 type:complete len:204 (-) Transcript_39707:989-1600(-)
MVSVHDLVSLEQLASYVEWFGPMGPPLYSLLLVISGFVPLPGFGVLILAAGFLFGFPLGIAIVYPSAVLGSCLAFKVGRSLPERYRQRLPKVLLDLQGAVHQGGFTVLLLLRLTPMPFAFSNLFLGSIRGIPFMRYACATALGFLRLSANVFLGSQMARAAEGQGSTMERAIGIGGTVAFVAVIGNVGRLMLKRRAAAHAHTE